MNDKNNTINNYKKIPTEHRRSSRYILAVLVTILFLLIIWGICLAIGSFVEVKQIIVEGKSPYSESQIIAVSGIEVGVKKKSIDIKETESDILKKLHYISDVKIKKKIGGVILIAVTSDQVSYVTDIANDYFVMSDSFRILGLAGDISFDEEPVFINLPRVKQAMIGSSVVFYEDLEYIDQFLDIINDSLLENHITSVDVSDRYNISIIYDDCYEIRFGELKNIDVKLRKLDLILTGDILDGVEKAIIDVSDTSNTIVKPRK